MQTKATFWIELSFLNEFEIFPWIFLNFQRISKATHEKVFPQLFIFMNDKSSNQNIKEYHSILHFQHRAQSLLIKSFMEKFIIIKFSEVSQNCVWCKKLNMEVKYCSFPMWKVYRVPFDAHPDDAESEKCEREKVFVQQFLSHLWAELSTFIHHYNNKSIILSSECLSFGGLYWHSCKISLIFQIIHFLSWKICFTSL